MASLLGDLIEQARAFSGLEVVAVVLAIALDLAIPPGSIPLYVTPSRIITSVALLLVAAVAGCAFSLRRVLRVDPASAIGTSS